MTGGSNGSDGKPMNLGFISDGEVTNALSRQYRVPTIDLADYVSEPAVLALVPRILCERRTSIPVSRSGNHLIVAMADPGNVTTFDELAAHTGLRIEAVVAAKAAILEAIVRYYGV